MLRFCFAVNTYSAKTVYQNGHTFHLHSLFAYDYTIVTSYFNIILYYIAVCKIDNPNDNFIAYE